MKMILVLLLALLMMPGCTPVEVYETVKDELIIPASAQPREVHFDLAQEPVMPVMETDEGQLYLCGDYDVMYQTFPSGDLEDTVNQVSGFSKEELTLIQTGSGPVEKYEFVWTCAADEGQQIGRATVLDDGEYHYVLSAVMAAELAEEYQEIWNGIFESFELA